MNWRPIVYVQDGVSLTQTKYGRPIFADAREEHVGPHILLEGDWERWVSEFLLRAMRSRKIPKEALCIDVGANCGWYSLLMRYALVQDGHNPVWAYEPHPTTAHWLRRTFSLNGMTGNECRVFEKALGNASGKTQLWFDPRKTSNASTEPYDKLDRVPVEVEVARLDDELPSDAAVAVMKIDVDWAEREVLLGADGTIRRNAEHILLLVEWHACKRLQTWLLTLCVECDFGCALIDHAGNPQPLDLAGDNSWIGDSQMVALSRSACSW